MAIQDMEELLFPGEVIFYGPLGEGNIQPFIGENIEIDGVAKHQDQSLEEENVKPEDNKRKRNKRKLTKPIKDHQDQCLNQDAVRPRKDLNNNSNKNNLTSATSNEEIIMAIQDMEELLFPGEVIFYGPLGEGNIQPFIGENIENDGVAKHQDQSLEKVNVKPEDNKRKRNKRKLTKPIKEKHQDQSLEKENVKPEDNKRKSNKRKLTEPTSIKAKHQDQSLEKENVKPEDNKRKSNKRKLTEPTSIKVPKRSRQQN